MIRVSVQIQAEFSSGIVSDVMEQASFATAEPPVAAFRMVGQHDAFPTLQLTDHTMAPRAPLGDSRKPRHPQTDCRRSCCCQHFRSGSSPASASTS